MRVRTDVIPQLDTRYIASLDALAQHVLTKRQQMAEWFAAQWQDSPPPVYGSVDLRHAGFKLAPIDMNLFPAGFNNLNPDFLTFSIHAAQKMVRRIVPQAQRLLILPEDHTRNVFYWENIKTLQHILEQAGFQVRLGVLDETMKEPYQVTLATGTVIMIEPLQRQANRLQLKDFVPEIILLNNDLSAGIPDWLKQLDQPVAPPVELGWSQRLKSEHFQYYTTVACEFAQQVGIDPWLITPLFRHCKRVDFMQQEGMDGLFVQADQLFQAIQKKYAEYAISEQPFLMLKADAGTYGMAVMTIRHPDELKTLNRKQRTRMSATKGGQAVHQVMIQEGIYTFETVGPDRAVAEPVVYLWGECVVGGFYRIHQKRGIDENLNAPGMRFEPLPFAQPCGDPGDEGVLQTSQHRFYLYGVIGQLSMLAAAREIKGCLSRGK